jgi:hypothetical protein
MYKIRCAEDHSANGDYLFLRERRDEVSKKFKNFGNKDSAISTEQSDSLS